MSEAKPRKQYVILNKKLEKLDADSLVNVLEFYAAGNSDDGTRAKNILEKLGIKY